MYEKCGHVDVAVIGSIDHDGAGAGAAGGNREREMGEGGERGTKK